MTDTVTQIFNASRELVEADLAMRNEVARLKRIEAIKEQGYDAAEVLSFVLDYPHPDGSPRTYRRGDIIPCKAWQVENWKAVQDSIPLKLVSA
jgi:hypothetical protein